MLLPVLLDHPDFVVINKSAGLSVHRDEGDSGLVEQLAQQLATDRLWLVHRLDKPTSGALLLARHAQAASTLAQAFASRDIQKTYLALSDRKPQKKQGRISGDMVKARQGAWRLTREQTHPAVTTFESRSLAPGLRLFTLTPHSGKTHQLRVAMKSLGSPILGDTLYGGSPAPRLFLHAHQLAFSYHGTPFHITAPLDEQWPAVL